MTERGIDFSHYQGTINWSAVKQSGVTFAIGKVTEGLNPDPMWNTNRAGSIAAGINTAGYHWAHPNLDPVACATAFSHALQQTDAMWMPFIDVEHNGNPTVNPTAAGGKSPTQIHAWLHAFTAKFGGPIGVYTGAWFWNSYVGPQAAACTQCAAMPLWLSRYDTTIGVIPKPWTRADVWQHSQTGRNPGVAGAVDLDVMVEPSTVAGLRALAHPSTSTTTKDDDMSAADVSAINSHTDSQIKALRTDTDLGTSIANVRAHQDSQGNQLADLQNDMDQMKATLATILAAVNK